MKTKAAILTELHKPLSVEEVEIPAPGRGQVLVRIKATGVCGSQLGEIDGRKGPDKWVPHLLGHEAGGVVEDTGAEVTRVKPGDHVVLHWRKGPGIEAKTPAYDWNGQRVNAGWITTFQDYTIISENRLTVIAPDVPFEVAALFGCCVTTGFGVIENDAKLKAGETVLVIGAGGVGLASIMAARIHGAGVILAADIHDRKLALARECGATHTIHSRKKDLRAAVEKILDGRHLDVVIENTGLTPLIELGYEICGPQGRTILVGVPDRREKASIDTLPLHFGKVLTGSHGGGIEPAADIPRLLELWRRGRIDCSKFLDGGRRYKLDEINEAIEALRSGAAIRPMVWMGEGKR
ncbi:MAG: dehydrogenase [Omnitrophica bacterium GWA2_52_8]|nr:MAG: dehydrogenase [Omnitrophica bacterium GWA2_52_8]